MITHCPKNNINLRIKPTVDCLGCMERRQRYMYGFFTHIYSPQTRHITLHLLHPWQAVFLWRNLEYLRDRAELCHHCPSRVGHATTLPRQCSHVFRPNNGWWLQYSVWLLDLKTEDCTFFLFILDRKKLYYVVTLSRFRCREATQLSRAQLCSALTIVTFAS